MNNDEKKSSKKRVIILLLLLIFIPILCYAGYNLGYKKAVENLIGLQGENLDVEKNLYDAGDLPVNGETSNVSEEKIDIPGYAKLTVDKDVPYISLMNLDTNTVYFVYSIYEEDRLLLKTDAIPPAKQIDTNFYELLGGNKGKHNLLFVIETYDLNTFKQCNGASQDVVVTVE